VSSEQTPDQAATSGSLVATDGEQRADMEQRRMPPEVSHLVGLAVELARGTQWPGGLLGGIGAALIGAVVAVEEISNRLASAEFVATLVVGALLALAGPLVVVYTNVAARRAAVEVEVEDKRAMKAEADQKRVEAELALEAKRREGQEFVVPSADMTPRR
jgi:hypothetical protein